MGVFWSGALTHIVLDSSNTTGFSNETILFGVVSLRVPSSFHRTSSTLFPSSHSPVRRLAFRGADVVVGRPRARSERPDVATSRGAVPLPGGVNMQ